MNASGRASGSAIARSDDPPSSAIVPHTTTMLSASRAWRDSPGPGGAGRTGGNASSSAGGTRGTPPSRRGASLVCFI